MLCLTLGFRSPRGWAAVEGFLFCKAAFIFALAVLLAFARVSSPRPIAISPVESGALAFCALLAAVMIFNSRESFGIGPREGWRLLRRNGGWMILLTAAVEAIQLGIITWWLFPR